MLGPEENYLVTIPGIGQVGYVNSRHVHTNGADGRGGAATDFYTEAPFSCQAWKTVGITNWQHGDAAWSVDLTPATVADAAARRAVVDTGDVGDEMEGRAQFFGPGCVTDAVETDAQSYELVGVAGETGGTVGVEDMAGWWAW